ncbi:MAG TPA: hypothetical protein PLE32_06575 [Haliscomenobacter sp.]|nr:hypothetical protein [Haliscomenobacter sp.]
MPSTAKDMLIAVRIIIILFIVALMVFMGHLSVRIEKRKRGEKYRNFFRDTLGSIWTTGGESFLPVPYLKEEADPFLERLRKKRNLIVSVFWLIWVIIVVFFIIL